LLRDRTPAQLGWIIVVANLLAVSGFAAFFLDSFHRLNGQRLPIWAGIVSLALLILGFIFEVFAESALKAGIGSGQWPEALIATPGKVFTHPAIPAVSLLLAVGAGIVVFFGSSHYAGLWVFVFPSLSAARVRQIFNRTAYA
jgi:hypothetical protein